MPRKDSSIVSVTAQSQQDAVSEGIEKFELPLSLITKLARCGMSDNMRMQKDVVLSFQKASTVFINYLAATAHEVASSKQHKSISASDVLKALETIEMADMVPTLQNELQVYREIQKADKNRKGSSSKGKAREVQADSASASVPTKAKSRGKEKEKGPTITINRSQLQSHSEHKASAESEFEVEDETEDNQAEREHDVDEDEDMADPEEEVDAEVDEDEVDDDGNDDEPEGDMVVEEEEISRDARGLDNSEDE